MPYSKKERALDARARASAKSVGLVATKSRRAQSVDNFGGYMLVQPTFNTIEAGERFCMSAEDVIAYCSDQ